MMLEPESKIVPNVAKAGEVRGGKKELASMGEKINFRGKQRMAQPYNRIPSSPMRACGHHDVLIPLVLLKYNGYYPPHLPHNCKEFETLCHDLYLTLKSP